MNLIRRMNFIQFSILFFGVGITLMLTIQDSNLLSDISYLFLAAISFLRPTLVLDFTLEASRWKMNRKTMEIWYPHGYKPLFSEKAHWRFGIVTGILLTALGVSDLLFHWMSKMGF